MNTLERSDILLFFSDRLKLEKMFYKWARSQTPMVKECPNSLIAFLEGNGLLNEEKVRHFIMVENAPTIIPAEEGEV